MKLYHIPFLLLFCNITMVSALETDLAILMNNLVKQDTASLSATAKPVLAVMPFGCGLKNEPAEAGRAVAEYTIAFFMNQPQYTIVERMEFAKIAGELALSQSGVVDEKKALEAGKMLSAGIIITGNIGEIMGARMISARMIATETGRVIAASSVTIGADKMQMFYRDALGERSQMSGTIFRSLLAPGWGQFYTNHPVQGTVFSVAAVGAVGALVWSAFDFAQKTSEKNAFKTTVRGKDSTLIFALRQPYVDAEMNAYYRTMTITGITIGVWVVNLIDAAILGRNEKRRVKELYFSANSYAPGINVAITF